MIFKRSSDPFQYYTLIILTMVWSLIPFTLLTGISNSYEEFVVLLTPFVIVSVWKFNWLGKYKFNQSFYWVFGLFFFAVFMGQIIPWYGFYSLDGLRSFNLKLLLIIFSFLFVFGVQKLRRAFMWGCFFALIVGALFGYYEWFIGTKYLPWNHGGHGFPDAISPFGLHKNYYGLYLAVFSTLTFGFGFYWWKREYYARMLCCFAIVVITAPVIFMTQSRAAFGGYLVSIFIFLIALLIYTDFNLELVSSFAGLFFVIALLILGFISINENRSETVLRYWDYDRLVRSVNTRTDNLWRAYWKQLEGQRMFGTNFSRDFRDDFFDVWDHENSVYMRFITASGLVGFGGFLILMLYLIYFSLKKAFYLRNDAFYWIHVGVFSTFVGSFLVRGLMTSPYDFEYLWAMLIATIFLKEYNQDEEIEFNL